jgi:hypothetical protein
MGEAHDPALVCNSPFEPELQCLETNPDPI